MKVEKKFGSMNHLENHKEIWETLHNLLLKLLVIEEAIGIKIDKEEDIVEVFVIDSNKPIRIIIDCYKCKNEIGDWTYPSVGHEKCIDRETGRMEVTLRKENI